MPRSGLARAERMAWPHMAGEPSGMCGVDGVVLQRRRLPDNDQPSDRQGLLTDLGLAHCRCDDALRAFTTDHGLAFHVGQAAIRSLDR
jgi:hypothetical protein